MWREHINSAASIVFVTELQLIWCLLLFCCCSDTVPLAASRLGQRQRHASLPQSSDKTSIGAEDLGYVSVQILSSLKAAHHLWEGCRMQTKPDLQCTEHAMLCALIWQTYMFTRLKKCLSWDLPVLFFTLEGLRGPPRRGATPLPSSSPSAAWNSFLCVLLAWGHYPVQRVRLNITDTLTRANKGSGCSNRPFAASPFFRHTGDLCGKLI